MVDNQIEIVLGAPIVQANMGTRGEGGGGVYIAQRI
jgi:hypothetical protein